MYLSVASQRIHDANNVIYVETINVKFNNDVIIALRVRWDRNTLPLRPRLRYIKYTADWLYCSGCWFHLGSAYLHIIPQKCRMCAINGDMRCIVTNWNVRLLNSMGFFFYIYTMLRVQSIILLRRPKAREPQWHSSGLWWPGCPTDSLPETLCCPVMTSFSKCR